MEATRFSFANLTNKDRLKLDGFHDNINSLPNIMSFYNRFYSSNKIMFTKFHKIFVVDIIKVLCRSRLGYVISELEIRLYKIFELETNKHLSYRENWL